ncbi:3-methyl-2-oxobutanoate dehydrogenase subunit VorB [Cetobacterium ceti]
MEKIFIKGNEAIGLAAIKAGCKGFFGYPITPQNEVPEYLSRELPLNGGVFIQAESEIAAINMVYGAGGCGARVMTSSSSPGIALKQEGISYLCGAEVPCLIVSVMRGGPGLGGIQPSQADYFQATRGGGNGDYYHPIYAPATVQETMELIYEAFDVADIYKIPTMVLLDGVIAQVMEPVILPEYIPRKDLPKNKDWATTGTKGKRKPNIINSLFLNPNDLEEHCNKLDSKYKEIIKNEIKWETFNCENSEILLVAYGTTSNICKNAIELLKKEAIDVGLFRPISIWPFPKEQIYEIAKNKKFILTVEMSKGQMIEDVKLSINGITPVYFFGRTGGIIPTEEEIVQEIKRLLQGGNL